VYKISFGSKRKLSIACAFLGNSELVLLDEPLMGVDLKAKEEIIKIFKKIRRTQKKIAIMISAADPELELI
jgi:ABC-type multidrug transport system ATPase subunit